MQDQSNNEYSSGAGFIACLYRMFTSNVLLVSAFAFLLQQHQAFHTILDTCGFAGGGAAMLFGMMSFGDAYKGKTVFVTGHTGFKGSWLSEWLLMLGANVVGYSMEPPTEPSHFESIRLNERLKDDMRGDIRSLDSLQAALRKHKPDFVFHLAAQPLVRRSFNEPHYTIETNIIGSMNVLEAVRLENRSCVVVMITTDKVYANVEWTYAYREIDPLGSDDPYSASKACADILISCYRQSFFSKGMTDPRTPLIAVAAVRGGNVIGGGDWAKDRIVPDSIRSLAGNKKIAVRNRRATRPWQHVLELLSGYLHLGAEISRAMEHRDHKRFQLLCSAFNFGPHITSNKTVGELVQEILTHWSGEWEDFTEPVAGHEAGLLNLNTDKAYHILGWQPQWRFEETIKHTVEWYRQYYQTIQPDPASIRKLTQRQIFLYAENLNYRALN